MCTEKLLIWKIGMSPVTKVMALQIPSQERGSQLVLYLYLYPLKFTNEASQSVKTLRIQDMGASEMARW